jgi:hypothetical protein
MVTRIPILLLLLCTLAAPAQEITLQLSPRTGTTFMLEYKSQMQLGQQFMGILQETGVETYLGLQATVSSLHNDTLVLTCRYRHLKVQVDAPASSVVLDSDAGLSFSDLLLADLVNSAVFRLRCTSGGQLISVEGIDSALHKTLEALPVSGIPDSHTEAMFGAFGDQALLNALKNLFMGYPVYPVKKSEGWHDITSALIAGIPFSSVNYLTLRDVQKNHVVVQSASYLQSTGTAGILLTDPPGTFALSGNAIAEAQVSRSTGLPLESNFSTLCQGKIQVKAEENNGTALEIPIQLFYKKQLGISGL